MNTLDKLLYNLTTIGSINKGCRINTTKDFITIEELSIVQGFWRWKNADSRDKAVKLITREVHTVISIVNLMAESQQYIEKITDPEKALLRRDDLRRIVKILLGTIGGINNICQTYAGDVNVSGCLSPLIQAIHKCIESTNYHLLALGYRGSNLSETVPH